jgi:tetratricopeptide (TPR) repeat protein
MKKIYLLFLFFTLFLIMVITSCRSPELEGAIVHFNADRIDNAYNLLIIATQKEPNNPEAWYYLGRTQAKKGMVKEMMESFNKSLSINNSYKNQIDLETMSMFSKFYNDGVSAYNQFIKVEDRKSEPAVKMLNSLITNFSTANLIKNDFMANRLIAVAYQNLADSVNELKYLEAAADVKPDTSLAWIELGYYYMQKKDYNKAAEYFKKGLAIEPNNVECITLYAQNLDFADRKDEAVQAYKEAMEKNPQERAIPFNLGLILNKMANATENDDAKKKELYSEAVTYFYKAHELDPELKDVYDLLSALLLQLNRYSDAEQILKEALQRFPESASVWQNWSYLQAKLGKVDEAKKAYEKSKQLQNE